jgi:hypothetical protein
MSTAIPIIVVIVAALLSFAAGAVIARRRGYTEPVETIARCRRGHLFTTVWVSKTAGRKLDLGWARVQRCPVGHHWTLVTRVDASGLTAEEKKIARKHREEPKS